MIIMKIFKCIPSGMRTYQIIKGQRRVCRFQVLTQMYNANYVRFNLTMALGLPFIWPGKKKNEPQSTEVGQSVSEDSILQKADNLFENGHYEECYKLLIEASKEGNNVEIQWRICRVLFNMSKESKLDDNTKRDLILQAYNIISHEIQTNYEHYCVHKWYALLLDAKSAQEGIKERIKQLPNVKKHMDLAVTINPNDATTLYMLGEWCYQVTEMPWHHRKIAEILYATPPYSSYEDALEYFLRAETAQPRFYSLNLLRLGNCYLKLQKEDQAKYYLKLAASYPAKSNDDHQANKQAAELLKRLK